MSKKITCTRCLGKGYVDNKDLKRLKRKSVWDENSECKFCKGKGTITENFASTLLAGGAVPHVPLNLKPTKRGSRFVHVGIDVKLYPIPSFLSLRGNRHPHIHYNDRESAMGAYWTAIKNNTVLNMPFPWRIKHVHALPEHRKRLARAVSKADADRATKLFLHRTLDEAYEAMVYKKGN